MALSPEQIRELFRDSGRRANRALGQNFCTDGALLERAARAALPSPCPVVEIGPGLGALTEELLKRAASVTAVEKDAFLAETLRALLPDERLKIVHADALKTDLASFGPVEETVIAGNLPYYITTPLLRKILPLLPVRCLFMLQKEASDRLFAVPGSKIYGPTSVLSETYYVTELLSDVPESGFYPQPDVRSACVLLERIPSALSLPRPDGFLRFVTAAFSMRRKTLPNNFPGNRAVPDALGRLGFPETVRAEDLSPDDFMRLYTLIPAMTGTEL